MNSSASWASTSPLIMWYLKCFDSLLEWKVLVSSNHFNCFNSYIWYFIWLLTAQIASRLKPSLAYPIWDEEKWLIMSFANLVRNIRSNKHSSVTTKSLRNILVSLCVISPCLFMTSKCFSSPFYLVWLICDHHSFVHCLSEPKPSTYLLFLPPRAL